MDTPGTIDLGLLDRPDADPAASRPAPRAPAGRARWIRRMPDVAPVPRGWRGLLVALGVYALLTGSLAPGTGSLRAVSSVALPASGDFRTFPDSIYTMDTAGGGGSEIVAYSPSGRQRWRVAVHATSDFISIYETGGVTLIMFGSDSSVRAVDTLDGRDRWQRNGARVLLTRGDRVLIVTTESDATGAYAKDEPDGTGAGPTGESIVLTWTDVRSGAPRWRQSVPSDWAISDITQVSTHAVALSPDNDIVDITLDETGARHTGTLLGLGHPVRQRLPDIVVTGDTLILVGLTRSFEQIRAYDLATLTPRWSDIFSGAGRTGPPSLSVVACGAGLCALIGLQVEGIDMTGGRQTWNALASIVTPDGGWIISGPPVTPVRTSSVIDPATGRVVLRLDRWTVLDVSGDGGVLFGTRPSGAAATELGYLAAAGSAASTATAGAPTFTILGTVPGTTSDCRVAGRYVTCATLSGQIETWQTGTR